MKSTRTTKNKSIQMNNKEQTRFISAKWTNNDFEISGDPKDVKPLLWFEMISRRLRVFHLLWWLLNLVGYKN